MKLPKPTEGDKRRFQRLVPNDPAVEVKPMFGNLGCFRQREMFTCSRATAAVTMSWMATSPKRITLSEPGVAGSYGLVERRADGSLVLRPERERLSDVMRET